MKKYKFYEMIGLLQDDENLHFETDYYFVMMVNNELTFVDKTTQEKITGITSDFLHEDYLLYNAPVSPFFALKAFAEEGKIIKIHKVDTTTKKHRDCIITSDMNNFEFSLDDLKYGEWYILN